MRLFRYAASSLIGLTFCVAVAAAETPKTQPTPSGRLRDPAGNRSGRLRDPASNRSGRLRDPARLLPDQSDLLVEVRHPRRLVETLTTLDTLKQLQQFAPVRELLDSTSSHRFYQLLAYFEKELGAPWPELLERLAGGGAVLGVKIGPNPAPSLFVIQGHDEQLMGKFFQLGLKVVEQELARQESKDKPVKGSYEGIDTVRIGTEFHLAVAGNVLFVSNNEKALHAGLDRHRGGGKKSMADIPGVHAAAKLLPPDPLVSFWLNMETVRKTPEADAVYKNPPRDDPNQTVLFGHYLDLLGRTPYVCAGVYPEKGGFVTTFRAPRGRDGMGLDQLLHVPPPGKPGSRPLLEPKNVLYSESSFLDISRIWTERDRLFNEKQVQALEKFDKQSIPFMTGAKVNKLLTRTKPYYRFVAVHQPKASYKTTPKISIPAFALVWELREPEAFGKSMETILRGAALLAGAQAKLKLVEEKYQGCNVVGYRFPEDQPLKNDVNDLRFNFSPCFTRVGDQFIWCSTIELCRELVGILQKEGTTPTRGAASVSRSRLYASGAVAYLRTIEDLLVTRITLDQAVTPKKARGQVKLLLDLVRHLGAFSLEPQFKDKTFQYDIRLQPEK